MNADLLRHALCEYVSILDANSRVANRAEDRQVNDRLLANAARMFLALETEKPLENLRQLVSTARHSYGWGYLAGSAGEAAESAFSDFANRIDNAT